MSFWSNPRFRFLRLIITAITLCTFCFVFIGGDYIYACNPEGGSGGQGGPNQGGGDPVHIYSGSSLFSVTDIFIPGRGFPLVFQRIYKSGWGESSILGNWDHNLNIQAKLNIAPSGVPVDMKRYSDGKSYEIYPRILISIEIKMPDGFIAVFNKEKDYFWAPNIDNPSVEEIMSLLANGEEISNPENEFSFWGIPNRLRQANTRLESLGAEHSKVIKNADNTITWRKKDGTKYHFSVFKGSTTRIKGADSAPWRKQPVAKILSIEDRNGNKITFQYNNTEYDSPDNKLVSVTDASGRQLTFTYGSDYVEITDNINRTWKYYLSDGKLVKVVDPLGNYVTYEYNFAGDLIKLTNKRGYSWQFTYDDQHRQTSSTDPLGNTITVSYSTYTVPSPFLDVSEGVSENAKKYRETKFTWPNGNTEIYTYDPVKGMVVKITDPSGLETLYQYDTDGNIIKIIARKNGTDLRTMHYFYDNYGNCIRAVLPMGNEYRWTYENTYNRPTAYYDPVGSTTTYTYDSRGNLIEVTDPENHKSTFTYNSYGEVIAITNSRGYTTTFSYNSYGYVTRITDPLGNSTEFAYDEVGNLTAVTDALNRTTTYEYDLLGRLIKITDAQNNVIQYEYDAGGNLIKITDPNGNITTYTYDALNRLIKVTDALNNITQYEYDSVGNLIKVIDANGNATTYEYEKALNITVKLNKLRHNYQLRYLLTCKTDPLGNQKTFTYDELGNLISRTDPNGNTVNFTYNDNDWLIQKTFPDNTTISYTYDNKGRRISVTDSNGTISYTYDRLDRVTQIVYPGNKVVKYSYDSTGNRTQIVYPDSSTVKYTYDPLNRISTITDFAGNVSTYTYNAVGRITELKYANGVQANFEYDSLNRLISLEYRVNTSTIYRSTYTYDVTGNILTKTFDNGEKWEYNYDSLYRLKKAVKKDSQGNILISHEYTYDGAGNRTTFTDLNGSKSYTYNADNRLLSVDGTSFGYDNNGNMTSKTIGTQTTSFEYDYRNQLIKITYPDATINTFKYDPYGRRIEKKDSSGTKKYLWDGIKVICEYDGNDNLTDLYAYGIGRRIISRKIVSSSSIYFYHQDELGSVVRITDINGNVVNKYEYDDFGNIISQTENISNDYTYTGKERDKDSGLYYFGARYYDPEIGRWLTKDPKLGRIPALRYFLVAQKLNRY
ncbi:MAG: hypothetical protein DRI36_02050, partial [Caldiserica bacterium]